MTFFCFFFHSFDTTMQSSEVQKLRLENQTLKATIKGLEYENKMYKQLLDNLFLGQQSSSNAASSSAR